jgi:hypothetical protein
MKRFCVMLAVLAAIGYGSAAWAASLGDYWGRPAPAASADTAPAAGATESTIATSSSTAPTEARGDSPERAAEPAAPA